MMKMKSNVKGAGPGQRHICARLPSTTTIKLLTCHSALFILWSWLRFYL
jgi:hypothetical protein